MEFVSQQTVQIKGDLLNEFHKFTLDKVFTNQASQQNIYEIAGEPIVESVLKGFNGTIFAYGQTSSGKTYTMQGPDIEDKTY